MLRNAAEKAHARLFHGEKETKEKQNKENLKKRKKNYHFLSQIAVKSLQEHGVE